ncbi:class I SAM-dependent methyltransferase [Nesterenkonia alba]|uniref:class I SAM-dependent methyltransferase n=1 Tax=Nesterenkonia alba TaxID=515814 RepID=UPI00048AF152|nr:methyltransferase [Nesterenkonia alba]
MAGAHYFSPDPDTPLIRRQVEVELAGRRVEVTTSGGIFSPDGIDKGTAVLLQRAPTPPQQGALLDLGCGWGPIALTMAQLAPQAAVWAVDVNERARTLCRENAEALGLDNVTVAAPDEVGEEVRFAGIWSNPPIRIGKAALHDLLLTWLPRLTPGGEAWLVVQKNLGADSLQRWLSEHLSAEYDVDRPASQKGFRLLRVERSSP